MNPEVKGWTGVVDVTQTFTYGSVWRARQGSRTTVCGSILVGYHQGVSRGFMMQTHAQLSRIRHNAFSVWLIVCPAPPT